MSFNLEDENDLLTDIAVKCPSNNNVKRRKLSVCQYKQLKAHNHGEVTCNHKHQELSIPQKWQFLAKRSMMLKDPFINFKLKDLPTQRVIRYQYDSINQDWTQDEVFLKMETKPFNSGAMRECFRVKKVPTYQSITHTAEDWKHASNYVSKRYMEEVARNVYFEDVRLQMDAKLWAEEFNLQEAIKKKVDIVRMCVIEFVDLPDKPLYHLEHFIEGNYIKYNSNSGFVDENTRNTPQAFSHFTFEKSGHELIVVDVQGVGDLYTDPQIHTACQTGYGDGNLGCRGMALFFHSHSCNMVCRALGLDRFDLSASEKRTSIVSKSSRSAATVGRDAGAPMKSLRLSRPSNSIENALISILDGSCSPNDANIPSSIEGGSCPTELFHQQSISELEEINHEQNLYDSAEPEDNIKKYKVASPDSGYSNESGSPLCNGNGYPMNFLPPSKSKIDEDQRSSPTLIAPKPNRRARFRFDSYVSDDGGKGDSETMDSFVQHRHSHRPSCAAILMLDGAEKGESILGKIHHEIAHMHESARFIDKENPSDADLQKIDWNSVLFHEKMAADLNYLDSVVTMANYYLGRPCASSELLENCPIERDPSTEKFGWMYLTKAANNNHLPSIMSLADSSDVIGGSSNNSVDWPSVAHWLNLALECLDQSSDLSTTDNSLTASSTTYQIKARLGNMYRQGGNGLTQDLEKAMELYSEAAEEATTAMKGRLASQYYEIVEEISSEME